MTNPDERITTAKGSDGKSSEPAKPAAGHRRLNVWLGTWQTTGRQLEGPVGPAAEISAVETFEWAKGGFFLVHRFDGKVADNDASCIEITGYDPVHESYPTRTYYSNGLTNDWQSHERDGVWTLTGDWDMAGTKAKTRCTTVFSDDGATLTGRWEMSVEGGAWQTFWDVSSARTG